VSSKERLAWQLITYHNIAYQMKLMRSIREAIIEGKFPEFVKRFMILQYPKNDYPKWAVDALHVAGITL